MLQSQSTHVTTSQLDEELHAPNTVQAFLEGCSPGHDPSEFARIYEPYDNKPVQAFMKRAFDVSSTLLGLSFIIVPLLALAAAIKLDSPGPLFFKQERIGKNGKPFHIYKFRSMYIDAEERLAELQEKNESQTGLLFKMNNDPRITKVGSFIRKYCLDELPQLINVLKGEMSLVGPRPPIQREVDQYKAWHHIRFTAIPGLTGPWQISNRAAIKSFDEVVELDFRYIVNWTFMRDIKLLFATIPVVLFGKGEWSG